MTQIPIYRGLKLGTENEYIEGYCEYIPNDGRSINTVNSGCWISWIKLDNDGFRTRFEVEVDPSTLSIHFPDMLDSQGNKIFASLSEDGKGGDKCSPDGIEVYFCVQDGCIFLKNEDWGKEISRVDYNNFKVIGIQQ